MNNEKINVSANQTKAVYSNLAGQDLLLNNAEKIETKISSVTQIIHDSEERCFYLLCNRFATKTGIYLVKFDEDDPQNYPKRFVLLNKIYKGSIYR